MFFSLLDITSQFISARASDTHFGGNVISSYNIWAISDLQTKIDEVQHNYLKNLLSLEPGGLQRGSIITNEFVKGRLESKPR